MCVIHEIYGIYKRNNTLKYSRYTGLIYISLLNIDFTNLLLLNTSLYYISLFIMQNGINSSILRQGADILIKPVFNIFTNVNLKSLSSKIYTL